jgi:hypothetical protein
VRLRVVEPEQLDQLAPDDPRALKLRRDLKRANTLMMHPQIMARAVYQHWRGDNPKVMVDLGSGDGTLVLRVAQRLAQHWRNVHVILLDRGAIVTEETRAGFAALGWSVEPVRSHVLEFFGQSRTEPVDIVTANLFIHQLNDQDLANLLAQIAPMTRLFVACELRRTKLVRELGRLQWLIGGGDVICYDGVVSARASFLGKEISALWPKQGGWELSGNAVGPLTHVFAARRQ